MVKGIDVVSCFFAVLCPARRMALMAAVALVALGCSALPSVGPDYEQPHLDVPQAWNAQSTPSSQTTAQTSSIDSSALDQPAAGGEQRAGTIPSVWWEGIRDPVLDSLTTRALGANQDLRIALSRIAEARALERVAAADFYPDIGSEAAFSRVRRSESGGFSSFSSRAEEDGGGGGLSAFNLENPQNSYSLGAASTWEIDVFGGLRRAFEAAQAGREVAEEDYRAVYISLLSEVLGSYGELRTNQRGLAIAKKNIEIQSESVAIVDARFQAGLASELDLVQAKAQLESTRAAVPTLEARVAALMHRISVLTGALPASLAAELAIDEARMNIDTLIPTPPQFIAVGMPSDVLRMRPDIRAAERSLAGATARIGVAMSDLYPKFDLGAAFGFQSTNSSNWLESGSRFWSFAPGVRWPIFSGGRILANIDIQEEQTAQALARYERTVLEALEEVENAIIALDRERARRDALSRSFDASARALDLSRELYTQGLADFLRVIDAQREVLSTEALLAQSEGEIFQRAVELHRALSTGWELEQERVNL